MTYQRAKAAAYAHKWAFLRNPAYYNFDDLGGDCTNFISQCLFAGAGVMNYTRETGWYYSSASNRAAAWTGVEFLFRFLTNNRGPGPFAEELPLSHAAAGDVIQLSFDGAVFSHSLLIVEESGLLVATHTQDADYRPLNTYSFVRSRLYHDRQHIMRQFGIFFDDFFHRFVCRGKIFKIAIVVVRYRRQLL